MKKLPFTPFPQTIPITLCCCIDKVKGTPLAGISEYLLQVHRFSSRIYRIQHRFLLMNLILFQ